MFRKIGLSAMVFTYFFAGAAHFLKAADVGAGQESRECPVTAVEGGRCCQEAYEKG